MAALLVDETTREAPRQNGRRGSTRRQPWSHVLLIILAAYFLVPLWWLIVASTKDINGLFTGAHGPMWFDDTFSFVTNIKQLFTQNGGLDFHCGVSLMRWFKSV